MKKQLLASVASAGIFLSLYGGEASAASNSYKVQSGDTLWKIANRNHILVSELKTWNHLSADIIYVGQELTLSPPQNQETYESYTVKAGDCLSIIAKKYETTITTIKSVNHLTSDIIVVGQVLKVPNGSGVLPKPSQNLTTYTVKAGDSLSLIAKNYKLTVEVLKSYNKVTSDTIYIGQVLRLTKPDETTKKENVFNADAVISEAKKYIGVPYVWGGSTPSGFDCSGFLNYVFNKQGIKIPRTVATIWDATKSVSSLQKGDIVFFKTTSSIPAHAGIYIGDHQFIHASSSSGVMISDMNNIYWKPRYLGAKTTE